VESGIGGVIVKIEINISTGNPETDAKIKERLESAIYNWLQDYLGVKVNVRD